MKIRVECEGFDLIDIDDVTPIQGNLKELSKENYEKLKKEILTRGFSAPFFIWKNKILDGTQRHRALQKMRTESIEVPKLPYVKIEAKDEKEAKQKLLGFASQYGSVTGEGLYEFLNDADISFDEMSESFHFPEINLDKFEKEFFEKTQEIEGQDDVPEITKTDIKLGDLFQLGNHRLLCGDSTDKAQVERLMNGEKADMVYTDPPYGLGYVGDFYQDSIKSTNGMKRTTNKFKQLEGDTGNWDYDPKPILDSFDYCKEVFMWGADYYCWSLPKDGSWICWNKVAETEMDAMPGASFELCWSKSKHKRHMVDIVWRGCFGHNRKTDGDKKVHPTQKPVKLAEFFFNKWGKDSKLVADLYLGSGSTLIACEKTNRRCFGCEIDPQYVQVIIDRWEKFTGQKAVLLTAETANKKQEIYGTTSIQKGTKRKSKGTSKTRSRPQRAKSSVA